MNDAMAGSHLRTVRVGIIGLGMAGGGMVPAIVSHPGIELAGAADLDGVLRDRFARDYGCDVDCSAAELVRRPDIDAVYIATPHQFHRDHAILAAQHGKHVVVEKPMALSLDDCDAMIAAPRQAGTVLIVGHTHSFDPAIRAMRDIIRSGDLGRVSMISMINYTDFIYRPRRPEELDTSKGGGILFNQIPHQVDIARLLARAPLRSVRAMTDILDQSRPTEGCCMAMLHFADGSAASLVYSGYDRFDTDELHHWIGEGGQPKTARHGETREALRALHDGERQARSELYGYGGARSPAQATNAPRRQPHFGMLVVTCERGDMRQSADGILIYSDAGVREHRLPQGRSVPGRGDVLDELYDAVVGGIAPVHDGAFGRGTVEACLAIHASAREGREIELSPLR
jgi:phthalate 4,5-cis-dihydrodiol dehydrogenase